MSTFTNKDKYLTVLRELAMRRKVYPRFVDKGSMKQSEANREIAVMAEIVEDYRLLTNSEEPDLFTAGGNRS